MCANERNEWMANNTIHTISPTATTTQRKTHRTRGCVFCVPLLRTWIACSTRTRICYTPKKATTTLSPPPPPPPAHNRKMCTIAVASASGGRTYEKPHTECTHTSLVSPKKNSPFIRAFARRLLLIFDFVICGFRAGSRMHWVKCLSQFGAGLNESSLIHLILGRDAIHSCHSLCARLMNVCNICLRQESEM